MPDSDILVAVACFQHLAGCPSQVFVADSDFSPAKFLVCSQEIFSLLLADVTVYFKGLSSLYPYLLVPFSFFGEKKTISVDIKI